MKKLFKLRSTKEHVINYALDLTEEYAQTLYVSGGDDHFSTPKRVPNGFVTRILTFEEWLQRYNIRIL